MNKIHEDPGKKHKGKPNAFEDDIGGPKMGLAARAANLQGSNWPQAQVLANALVRMKGRLDAKEGVFAGDPTVQHCTRRCESTWHG